MSGNPARQHRNIATLLTAALTLAAFSPMASAQDKPDFPTIRETELAEIDRNNVEAWVAASIRQLLNAQNDANVQTQGRDFFQTVRTNVKDASATEKFRQGMASIMADAFVQQYPTAPANRRPLAEVYILMSLSQPGVASDNVIDALELGLTSPRPAGRVVAVNGLRELRDKLTAEQWSQLVPVIQEAAAKEPNGVTLGHMYRFLMATQAERIQQVIPAFLAILQARLERFEQRESWPVQSDVEAVRWLSPRIAGMQDPQQQNQATLAIARLMTNAVYAYLNNPGEKYLEPLERVIVQTEEELTDVVRRRAAGAQIPSVSTPLLAKIPPDRNAVLLALNNWIGNAQQEGLLNRQPFGFERGLNITVPPAATQPAETPDEG